MRLSEVIKVMLVICVMALGINGIAAQDRHFVYLQSDKQQPFYVKINGRNISSSANGYAIIPKLADSTYGISIGFAGSSNVQQYQLAIAGANQGYLIKDFGERGFGLFDFLTTKIQISGEAAEQGKAMAAANNEEAARKQNEAAELAKIEAQNKIELEQKRLKDSADTELAKIVAQNKAYKEQQEIAAKEEQKRKEDAEAAKQKDAADKAALLAQQEEANKLAIEKAKSDAESKQVETIVPATKTEEPTVDNEALAKRRAADSTKAALEDILAKNRAYFREQDSLKAVAKKRMTDSLNAANEVFEKGHKMENGTVANGNASPTDNATTGTEADKKKKRNKRAEDYLADPAPASPTFLNNIEFVADTTAAKQEEVAAKKAEEPAKPNETTEEKEKREKKKTGIFSNNNNTKIVVNDAPVADTAEVVAKSTAVLETAPTQAPVETLKTCKEASEKDFFEIRKKMVLNDDTDEMMLVAKRAFKEKCYTTAQLRNLCALFLSDNDRYAFLDMAYPFASDKTNYASLQDILKDSYNINRFKAMLK